MVTIFSLNLNNYFDNELQKICLNSWYNYKNNNLNIKNIIIYNKLNPEYIEFWKLFSPIWDLYTNKRIEFIADAFRIYILSKHNNYLWLDGDVLISEDALNNIFLDKIYFDDCWDKIYNANNTRIFKMIWDKFLNKSFLNMKDKEIFHFLKFNRPSNIDLFNWNRTFIHLSAFKKQCFIYVIINNDDFNYYQRFNKLWCSHKYKLIVKNNDRIIFCTKESDFFKKQYRGVYYFSNKLKSIVDFADKKFLPKLIEDLEKKYNEE